MGGEPKTESRFENNVMVQWKITEETPDFSWKLFLQLLQMTALVKWIKKILKPREESVCHRFGDMAPLLLDATC